MTLIKNLLYSVLLLSASILLLSGAHAALTLARVISAVPDRVDQVGRVVDQHANAIQALLDRRIGDGLKLVDQRAGDSLAVMDRRVGNTLDRADMLLSSVGALEAKLDPALEHISSITEHADEASTILLRRDALPAQLLGLTAAAKVTLGQTAQTMREVERATPRLISSADRIAENVEATTKASTEASQNTAQVMKNFAKATKPLPTWARIGLAVAPSLTQTAFSIASIASLTGR